MKRSIFIILMCIVFALSGATTFADTDMSTSEEPQTETTVTDSADYYIDEELQTEVGEHDDATKGNEGTQERSVTLKSNGYEDNQEELRLDTYNLVADLSYEENLYPMVYVLSGKVDSVASSNEKVATATLQRDYYGDYYISISSKDVLGKTTITVTDVNGNTKVINVTFKSAFEIERNSFTINSYKTYLIGNGMDDNECISSEMGWITNVSSSNTKVIKITKYSNDDQQWKMNIVGVGTATITCFDKYGQKVNCKVTVTKNAFIGMIKARTTLSAAKYGDTKITGTTLSGASVTANISGKKYTAKANSKGKFSLSVPITKIGTKIKYNVTYKGYTYTRNASVINGGNFGIHIRNHITRKTKKVRVEAENVHKGDVIILKIGKKKYKKKIKKDASYYNCKFKIKKNKIGKKVTVSLVNKYNQTLTSHKEIVYYSTKLKKGMKRKYCKYVPGWEHPHSDYYDGKEYMWWYQDGSWLVFNKRGKLTSWGYQ